MTAKNYLFILMAIFFASGTLAVILGAIFKIIKHDNSLLTTGLVFEAISVVLLLISISQKRRNTKS